MSKYKPIRDHILDIYLTLNNQNDSFKISDSNNIESRIKIQIGLLDSNKLLTDATYCGPPSWSFMDKLTNVSDKKYYYINHLYTFLKQVTIHLEKELPDYNEDYYIAKLYQFIETDFDEELNSTHRNLIYNIKLKKRVH